MPIVAVGLTTGNFANRLIDLPACLDKFEALGVDSVELSLGALDVIAGAKPLKARIEELKRICADRPLRYTLHGPIASRFTDPGQLQLQMDVCRAALDVAAEIGATAQVHHSGDGPTCDYAARERAFNLERETLAKIAPHAEGCGVRLCVENIFGDGTRWFLSPAELAAQLKAVDHPYIRATIDFSHAALNANIRGYDLMAELATLAPLAGHLHIHDSFGQPPRFEPYTYGERVNFGFGDLHLPPGWGALDWDAIAALPFAEEVVANLELSTRFEDSLEEAVAVCRRMAAISKGEIDPAAEDAKA